MKHILISAGDFSGDEHAKCLVTSLKKRRSNLKISALGGNALEQIANTFLANLVDLDLFGPLAPIKQFFKLQNILNQRIIPLFKSKTIDAVILVDYYGFNSFIGKKAFQFGIPVYYFVSPQVWATRPGRIQKLKQWVKKMLVIFPFEETLYKKHGVPVEFVGHPILDSIEETLKLPPSHKNSMEIGLMPGSRIRELSYHMPILIQAAIRLKKKIPNATFTLFQVHSIPNETYDKLIEESIPKSQQDWKKCLKRITSTTFKQRLNLKFSLTGSGSVALENALLGIPMVIFYKTTPLIYSLVRPFIQTPYISIPNILTQKELIPELLQGQATAKNIAIQAEKYLCCPKKLEIFSQELIQLKDRLGSSGAYQRAADSILNLQ